MVFCCLEDIYSRKPLYPSWATTSIFTTSTSLVIFFLYSLHCFHLFYHLHPPHSLLNTISLCSLAPNVSDPRDSGSVSGYLPPLWSARLSSSPLSIFAEAGLYIEVFIYRRSRVYTKCIVSQKGKNKRAAPEPWCSHVITRDSVVPAALWWRTKCGVQSAAYFPIVKWTQFWRQLTLNSVYTQWRLRNSG